MHSLHSIQATISSIEQAIFGKTSDIPIILFLILLLSDFFAIFGTVLRLKARHKEKAQGISSIPWYKDTALLPGANMGFVNIMSLMILFVFLGILPGALLQNISFYIILITIAALWMLLSIYIFILSIKARNNAPTPKRRILP